MLIWEAMILYFLNLFTDHHAAGEISEDNLYANYV
jgi:hypothetical protein